MLLPKDWQEKLADECEKPYYEQLWQVLHDEYEERSVYPPMRDVYNAFAFTAFDDVKVVLLGQDPYHKKGQAHGLSFSVQPGTAIPPSLRNIFKELSEDLGCLPPEKGSLVSWAKQGVLLLNTVLTVREGEPYSHQHLGWENFTDRVISCINEREKPVVFLLWGRHAQAKRSFIDEKKHYVLMAVHPSPLSARRGFFGSKPFSKVNAILEQTNQQPIDWKL